MGLQGITGGIQVIMEEVNQSTIQTHVEIVEKGGLITGGMDMKLIRGVALDYKAMPCLKRCFIG